MRLSVTRFRSRILFTIAAIFAILLLLVTTLSQFTSPKKVYAITDAWTATSTINAPSARSNHIAVWTGTEMLVFGGTGNGGCSTNVGYRYNPTTDTWSTMSTVNAPSPRTGHDGVWTGTELIVFSGNACGPLTNTGARYNPVTDTWTPISTVNAPIPRSESAYAWTGTELITWSGYDNQFATSTTNTGARYNPVTDTWTTMSTVGAPSKRASAIGVWTGTEFVVWGGADDCCGPSGFPSGGRYNPLTDTWTAVAPGDLNAGQKFHTSDWTGNEMIVWSGIGINGYTSTGQRYNPVTDTWTPISTVNAPSTRAYSEAIWTGNEYFVFGGYDGATFPFLNTGGLYDPIADTWTATNLTNAPSYRDGHTLVWTGSDVIVWGGLNNDGSSVHFYDTGARYGVGEVSPTPTPTPTELTTLDDAKVWVGLKNSDDIGVKFDILAEVFKDGVLVSSGQINSVTWGGTSFSNPNNLRTIPFNAFAPVNFPSGSELSMKLSVRNACVGSGHNSGTARLWYNDTAVNTSRFGATIGGNSSPYYLLDGFVLGTTSGTPRKFIDVKAGAKCSPFKPFGTWDITL